MKLRIGSKDYDLEVLDRLTLAQTIVLDHELRAYPFHTSLVQVKDLMRSAADDDWSRLVVTAVTVWSARALAGERMPLLDALDFPVSEMSWIGDDGQEITGEPEPAADAEGKSTAPAGSGATGNRAQRRATKKRTSSGSSTPT